MRGLQMNRKTRRVFSPEFKEDAVNLVIKQGYSMEKAAERLDLSRSALGKWVRAKRQEENKSGLSFSEKEELIRLRKALKQAEMGRDILKKAAAFFAKEQL